ncbi:hypothetical protein BaRGS_00031379, partial [Batillaria attramentaria]
DVDMDPHQRSLLNSFGPVRHALLTSSHDPQRRVHVVYDADSSNFVLTELKQEVEKRTKLTLILPDVNHNPLSEQEDQLDVEHNTLTVKGNEFLAKLASCRMTCVVVGSDRPPFPMYEIVLQQAWGDVYGNILQQAAKEAEHAGNQIVFLQREETCPDWVLNRLETCTVMMYPERQSRLGQSARFWRELPAVFEDVDMDPHQRSLLNSFGPVRHALLTSSHDPQRGVHVVYDADSSNFVLTELKQEVEKRTKLTLILPDMNHNPLSEQEDQLDVEHNTLSVKGNEFLAKLASCRKTCVVVGSDRPPFPTFLQRAMSRSDVYGNILQQAVKEAEHAGRQIVFLQRGETCPDWVLNKLESCTVMVYPNYRETSDMDLHHQRLLNSFGPVQHAAFMSSRDPQQGVHVVYDAESSNFVLTELKEELEQRTGLRLVLPDMEHKALSEQGNQPDDTLTMQGSEFCATVALCRKTCVVLGGLVYPRSGEYDKMMQQAVLEEKHPDIQTVFIQRGETCPGWVLDRQDTCTVITYQQSNFFSMRMFQFFVREEVWESLTAFVGYVSTAPQPQSQIPSADDTSEGKSATDAQRVQNQTPLQPIFSSKWQTVDTVTSSGGTVRKQYSDVILTVPSDAVDEDSQVDIHTAVCTDVDRVRRVVKLSEDECVSSPVAEYWAGHEFRFKKPVTITLPHFLPPDPDPSLVRVYRVTRRPDGEIVSTRLRPQPSSSIDATPVNEHGVGTDHPAVSQAYQREDAAYRTAKEAEPTLPTDAASPAMKADDFPEHCLDQDVEWEEAATFQLTTGGHVIIITNRFSGYVCTYCGRHGPPVLNVLVCGTHTQESADRQTAEVSVHVWDGRIHIADFRQDYGIGIQNHILCSRTLDVLPDLLDSRLHMRLVIGRLSKNDWQHSLGDIDLLLSPVQQRHDLRHVLSSCDTRDCRNSSHITRPISAYWMLETLPERHPQPWLQCAVYVCQVASNTEPSWSDREGVERSASLPVKLPKQKDQRAFATQTDDKRDITTGNGGGSLPKASTQKYDRNGTTSSLPVSRQPPDVHGAAGYQNDHENTQDKHHVSDNHSHAEGVALNGQSYPPFLLEQFDQLTDSFKRQLMSGPSQNAGNPTSGASNFAQANGSLVRGQSAEAGAVGGSSYSVTQNIYINNQPMTNNIGKIQGETTNLASTVTSNHGAPPGSGLNQLANALPNNGGNNSALPAPWGHERNGLEYERNGPEYERNGPEYERNGLERVHEHEAAQLENEMEPDPQNGEHLTDTNNPVCSPEEDQM